MARPSLRKQGVYGFESRLALPLVGATMVVGDLGASGQRVDGDNRLGNLINRSLVIPDLKRLGGGQPP